MYEVVARPIHSHSLQWVPPPPASVQEQEPTIWMLPGCEVLPKKMPSGLGVKVASAIMAHYGKKRCSLATTSILRMVPTLQGRIIMEIARGVGNNNCQENSLYHTRGSVPQLNAPL